MDGVNLAAGLKSIHLFIFIFFHVCMFSVVVVFSDHDIQCVSIGSHDPLCIYVQISQKYVSLIFIQTLY